MKKLILSTFGLLLLLSATAKAEICVGNATTEQDMGLSVGYQVVCSSTLSEKQSFTIMGIASAKKRAAIKAKVTSPLEQRGIKQVGTIEDFDIFSNEQLSNSSICVVNSKPHCTENVSLMTDILKQKDLNTVLQDNGFKLEWKAHELSVYVK
jgi:hypothetical protein